MTRKIVIFALILAFVGIAAFAQDLKLDYRLDFATAAPGNYFTFTGPIRYMAADKDYVDSATGASRLKSTSLFQPYRLDVKGKNALPDGLRGLFLFAVGPAATKTDDKLTVARAGDGTISVNFVHRGTAYQLISDKSGRFSFPSGQYQKRVIGYIEGAGPQVISRDFSSNGTAAGVDWAKVWNASTPDGREVAPGKAKTGKITPDVAASDSMFFWQGSLQAAVSGNILTISGGLDAAKR